MYYGDNNIKSTVIIVILATMRTESEVGHDITDVRILLVWYVDKVISLMEDNTNMIEDSGWNRSDLFTTTSYSSSSLLSYRRQLRAENTRVNKLPLDQRRLRGRLSQATDHGCMPNLSVSGAVIRHTTGCTPLYTVHTVRCLT